MKNYNKLARDRFSKEDNLKAYESMNSELDLLVDEISEIRIYSGKRVLVDKDQTTNRVRIRTRKGYTECTVRKITNGIVSEQSLSRFIMCVTDKSLHVDHENTNTLDNRKSNLRICTASQNNTAKAKRSKLQPFKGIELYKTCIKIFCQKDKINRVVVLDTTDAVYAAKVRDCMAIKLQGEFAYLNFDRSTYTDDYVDQIYDSISDKIYIE